MGLQQGSKQRSRFPREWKSTADESSTEDCAEEEVHSKLRFYHYRLIFTYDSMNREVNTVKKSNTT